ncbi:isocitrate lyase/phosphoenolpyruvate mutase family protein [Saccharopolyspora erythraea]|uniref:isocitrate lyase/PEP mutase family protein n=1 Tax=Saccharopolyspora erythraea TaxID=1836 RepID=UPI001BA7DD08|nr:isocitrate lyase/phosphoenolpyruvate mutase family protein [Saccharopolyspora erythraea]QUH00038.1 isocitrate lyase/phosphoenolpyruvate mutase family protein [Saccharopolyspora erythraea]
MSTAAERFRALHRAGDPLLLPNAWDFASAAALAAAGFPAVATTSLGVAAAHGLPDAEGAAKSETLALARRLVRLPCPVTVDAEAGFDDPVAVAVELAEAGVAGINLEDGRSGGLADPAEQAALLREVKRHTPELFLNARIDTHWLREPDVPGMLDRARRYEDAGADGVFVPGLTDPDDIRTLVASVALPVNVLCPPAGIGNLADLGVRRISTGSLLYRTAVHIAVNTARGILGGRAPQGAVAGYEEFEAMVRDARMSRRETNSTEY